jgi:hypothetical protein
MENAIENRTEIVSQNKKGVAGPKMVSQDQKGLV